MLRRAPAVSVAVAMTMNLTALAATTISVCALTGAAAAAVEAGPAAAASAPEPQVIRLWTKAARGDAGGNAAETVRLNEHGEHIVSNVHAPSITVFLPAANPAATAAVVVIPGGGHAELWMDHEGYNVAAFLTAHGVAAFVLKYRLARAPGSTYTVEGDALADAQRAIRLVRSRSAQWHVDPQRVGVMGFSAGGELAVLAATRPAAGITGDSDPVQRQSARPDFQVLLYPALPKVMMLSKDTPPAFLLAGSADQAAISEGLARLYLELHRAGVPAELHIYDGVGHGFGLRSATSGPVAGWPQRLMEWLSERGIATADGGSRPATDMRAVKGGGDR